jgi:bifunctional non-homologous end joining protein LigD
VPLERYRLKRDFARTPEPRPGSQAASHPPSAATPGGWGRFVVHRHRASRLHYDLRLEVDGVLVSWALPHGPTRDPSQRRFAARTEDHPIEYLDFEGVIPRGEYGAGDSISWDWGTFEPEITWDPGAAIRAGELKFRLHGVKLAGRFTLVRTGSRASERAEAGGTATIGGRAGGEREAGEGDAWLLVAKAGPEAVSGWSPEDHPASVRTGRTSDEVAAGVPPRFERTPPPPLPALDPPGSRLAAQPSFVEPMLASPARVPFDDPDWLFEPKWDGYRVQAVIASGKVTLWTRNRKDAGACFPELLEAPTWLAAAEAIVDGEVVALGPDGRPDFGLLQARVGGGLAGRGVHPRGEAQMAARAAPLVFMAFDLPWCAGRSYLDVPLAGRKEILRLVLREHPRVRYAGHVERDGVAFFAAAAAQGLEGAMAKHRLGRYEPGQRSTAWLKLKVRPTQDFVVGGYVPGRGSHRDLGALLVGVTEAGRLRYAGRVGSGLDAPTRARLRAALDSMARPDPPFADAPAGPALPPGATWAAPELVISAEIGGWTRDGLARQAAYIREAPEVDPATVERQDVAGPEAAGRALARAGVGRGAPGPAGAGRSARTRPALDQAAVPAPVRPAVPPAERTEGGDAPQSAPGAGPTPDELAALDALPARGGTWRVDGQDVALTNLDRVVAPALAAGEPPLTKRDLVRYLVQVGPLMLPHLAGRALNLVRFPDGIERASFWQKEAPKGTPEWVTRWQEPDPPDRRPHVHVVADRLATLAWLGNQAAVELHPWTSPIEAPAEPRWALFDIDPGPITGWDETLVLARLVRRALEHLGLVGAPKVSGKRGIQVFVPVRPGYTFEETRAWVEQVSRAVGAAVPDLVSWEWSKDRRDGRARLDFTQNWRNRTLVGAYSPRPAPGLPVSAPVSWDELDDPLLRPDRWTVRTILARIAEHGDLFRPALGPGQELPRL